MSLGSSKFVKFENQFPKIKILTKVLCGVNQFPIV